MVPTPTIHRIDSTGNIGLFWRIHTTRTIGLGSHQNVSKREKIDSSPEAVDFLAGNREDF